MPVCLDPCWIVCLNDMNWLDLLGELKANLSLSSKFVVGATDFVLTPSTVFDEVDKTKVLFLVTTRRRFDLLSCGHGTQCSYDSKFLIGRTVLANSRDSRTL